MESRKRLTAEKRGRGTGKGAIPAVSVLAAAFGAGVQLAVFGRIGQSGGVFYTSPCLVYMGIYVLTAFCLPRAAAAAVSGRVRRGQADPGALLAGSLALAAVAGGAGAALLGFGGEMLAAWSGRPMERYAWEALAPAVWLMALLGALRGHFLGLGGSAPAAVSMILEQAAGGAAALWFAGDGLREGSRSALVYGAEELEGALGAAGAMAGPAVGAGAGLLFLLGMTVLWRKNLLRRTSGRKASPARQVMPLLLAGIPGLFMAAAWAGALALQIKWYGTASGNRWGEFGFWCLAADLLAAVSAAVGVPAASRLSGRRPGAREGLVRALRRLPVPCILGAVLLAAGAGWLLGCCLTARRLPALSGSGRCGDVQSPPPPWGRFSRRPWADLGSGESPPQPAFCAQLSTGAFCGCLLRPGPVPRRGRRPLSSWPFWPSAAWKGGFWPS